MVGFFWLIFVMVGFCLVVLLGFKLVKFCSLEKVHAWFLVFSQFSLSTWKSQLGPDRNVLLCWLFWFGCLAWLFAGLAWLSCLLGWLVACLQFFLVLNSFLFKYFFVVLLGLQLISLST